MSLYKHILVAVDLIPSDDELVTKRAMRIAHQVEASISLIHVVEYFYLYGAPWKPETGVDWQDEVEKVAQKKMGDLGEKLGIAPANQILHIGKTMDVILQTAHDIESDLIVVGSHGRHGLGLMLFGSTSNSVVQKANCDVLAVRIDPALVIKEQKKTLTTQST